MHPDPHIAMGRALAQARQAFPDCRGLTDDELRAVMPEAAQIARIDAALQRARPRPTEADQAQALLWWLIAALALVAGLGLGMIAGDALATAAEAAVRAEGMVLP